MLPGNAYTIRVLENCWAGIYSFSEDNVHWQQFSAYHQDDRFDYTFTQAFTQPEVYVAMMEPYLQAHLERLVGDVAHTPCLQVTDLWTSEEGRFGKLLTVTKPSTEEPKRQVWLTARMHAFEAAASRVAEGLVRWLISDEPAAQRLRATAAVHVIPMMDIDAVECGSSGKHREPIDFARDGCDSPHWNANRALLGAIERTGGLDLYLDLHNPGGNMRDVYFYVEEEHWTTPAYERDLATFTQAVREALGDTLPCTGRLHRCHEGPDDRGQSYAGLPYFYLYRRYFGTSPLRLSLCIETPWSCPGSSAATFLRAGVAYGKAIAQFVTEPTRS